MPEPPDPLAIPPLPADPILSRRTPLAPPEAPLAPFGRLADEEHELRHFALALALVFAPAAVLLSLAMLPGP